MRFRKPALMAGSRLTFVVFRPPSQEDQYATRTLRLPSTEVLLKVHSDTSFRPLAALRCTTHLASGPVGAGEGHDPGAPKPPFIPDPAKI